MSGTRMMRIIYQTTVRFFVFDWCRWNNQKKKNVNHQKFAMNPKFGPTVVDITPRKHAQVRNFMNVTSSDTKLHLYYIWLVFGGTGIRVVIGHIHRIVDWSWLLHKWHNNYLITESLSPSASLYSFIFIQYPANTILPIENFRR